jgi:hypothetical protein
VLNAGAVKAAYSKPGIGSSFALKLHKYGHKSDRRDDGVRFLLQNLDPGDTLHARKQQKRR